MANGISMEQMEAADRACRQEGTMENKSTLYSSLAKAQTEMGKANKDGSNPHFKSSYATLASVMDACMEALNKNDIAITQPLFDEDGRSYVKTVLTHGPSGEAAECRVPLIVSKNDMQGYGSAVTYARRYGLMSMAGIAPEDDDGNAAAKAAPKYATSAHMKRSLTDLEADLVDAGTEVALHNLWGEWVKKMNEENWPEPRDKDDETAYVNIVRGKFRDKGQELKPQQEAAE